MRRLLIGHKEISDENQEHWHAIIVYDHARARSTFAQLFQQEIKNMWLRPLEVVGKESYLQAQRNFAKYACKDGKPVYQRGFHPFEIAQTPNAEVVLPTEETTEPDPPKKTKTSDIIKEKVLQGASMHELVSQFPGCVNQVRQLIQLHPRRYDDSICLYVHGPTGVGKTTNLTRVLNHIREHLGITYYFKVGGLSKFFNGYDFQDIVIIDDPVEPGKDSEDQVQMFKTIINNQERSIEIKGGHMPWDSRLVIITANISPNYLAKCCGATCSNAIFRRLTSPIKSLYLEHPDHERYCKYLLNVIKSVFHLEYDTELVYSSMPPYVSQTYDIQF